MKEKEQKTWRGSLKEVEKWGDLVRRNEKAAAAEVVGIEVPCRSIDGSRGSAPSHEGLFKREGEG